MEELRQQLYQANERARIADIASLRAQEAVEHTQRQAAECSSREEVTAAAVIAANQTRLDEYRASLSLETNEEKRRIAAERDRMNRQATDITTQFERVRAQNELLRQQLMENAESKAIED